MKKFYIFGGNPLYGEVKISGSKNSILPILSFSLLSKENILIKNVPKITDVEKKINLLKYLGSDIKMINSNCYINNKYIKTHYLPFKFSSSIRSSIWIIPPLLFKFGKIKTFFPGGCDFCLRPIDLHLKIFKQFGIKVIIKENFIKMNLINKKIFGSKIFIEKISVGATITAIGMAVLACGETIIENISNEPEVLDTIKFLNSIGANIHNINNNKILIIGVKKLHGGEYRILPDRIETGTFLIAGAITRGKITCINTKSSILKNVINFLISLGANVKFGENWISLIMNKRPKSISFETNNYPGIPTDLQPQFTSLSSISYGQSVIIEKIFSYRFSHVNELLKMKANLYLYKNKLICKGVKNLFGNYVYSKDLRSSASLILAGLCAYGQTTVIDKLNYIDRGYENFLEKLKTIGSKIIVSKI